MALVKLFVLGTCPWRPIASSHYFPAPYASAKDADKSYLPSAMTHTALVKGLEKFSVPMKEPFSEELLCFGLDYLVRTFGLYLGRSHPITYPQAVSFLDCSKSAGFPWYYAYEDKYTTICEAGPLVRDQTMSILSGVEVDCLFSVTLKDELREAAKVVEQKTRVFMAAPIHQLLASKMLYHDQNQKLMDAVGEHPITLGIKVPGVPFVRSMLKLHPKAQGADGARWDAGFPLCIARVICAFRAMYLPIKYHKANNYLYRTVYVGAAAVLGKIYAMWHGKSGGENTSTDNSFYMCLVLFIGFSLAYPTKIFERVVLHNVNSDDVAFSTNDDEVSLVNIAITLAYYGVDIEVADHQHIDRLQVVYLSHQCRPRYTHGLGDMLVAAGNLKKLLSSLYWIKRTATIAVEETCVAHLIGLRLCLWPWREHFLDVDDMLREYLNKVVPTPFILRAVRARLTESQIALLHCSLEGSFYLSKLLESGFDISEFHQINFQAMARKKTKNEVVLVTKTNPSQPKKNKNKKKKNSKKKKRGWLYGYPVSLSPISYGSL